MDRRIWPGIGAAVSLYFSAISLAIGIVMGYLATRWFIKKYYDTGKYGSVFLNIAGNKIHLHHWIMGAVVLLIIPVIGSYGGCPKIVLGIIGGVIAEDFNDVYHPVRSWFKGKEKV